MIAQPNALVLVAELESLLGFCASGPSRDADATLATGEITALYVEPERWRTGIGRALIEATLRSAPERNFAKLTLWVLSGNLPARRFYEASGFSADGVTKAELRSGFSLHETRYARAIDGAVPR